ncbi:MAG: hypothetical protein MR320_01070, partial [Enterococcus gallinarum]|nr:hypothetical protein [Enterococcus gallinarum]
MKATAAGLFLWLFCIWVDYRKSPVSRTNCYDLFDSNSVYDFEKERKPCTLKLTKSKRRGENDSKNHSLLLVWRES